MKKQCRILVIDKKKLFVSLQAVVLLVLSALLNTGCYPATLAPSEENLRSKQLTPPAGKALVYFYLDCEGYAFIDVAVSLNGFRSRISKDTYVLWEVFPGEYLLEFEDGKLEIQCEANQIYYFYVSSVSIFSEKLAQAKAATGRAKINEFPLVKWFKDVPAPPETGITSGEEVAVDNAEPDTDSFKAGEDTQELKSAKNMEKMQEIDSTVVTEIGSTPTESAQLEEKAESATSVTPVPITSTQIPFVIRDPKFEAAYKGECNTDATITSVKGDSFEVGGQVSMRNGAFVLWCYGAKHTWKGRLTYADYVFDSDNENPLQFMVDKDEGYVYLGGKGTVTLPDRTVVQLPVEHTDGYAAVPGTISGELLEVKQGEAQQEAALDAGNDEIETVSTAQQAVDPNTDTDKVDKQELDEEIVESLPQEFGETDKPQPSGEVIGTIRLIMQKDSDVTVTTYLYDGYNPFIKTGSVTRDRFEYEPDTYIKASLEQMEFEVIPEDSNRPEDATLAVHYEEKKRGAGLDSPTAYYFSFSLSHKTKGTLLEESGKTTGFDSVEELENHPQFRDIGVLVRKAFVQDILDHKEAQQSSVPTQQQLADTAKSNESVAKKSLEPEKVEVAAQVPPDEVVITAQQANDSAKEISETKEKGTISIHFQASSARSRIGSDGKMNPIFIQNIDKIEENIRSRLSEAGFRIIPETGEKYDALLYIHYHESMSSVPQWGNTEYNFGFTLEDANGVKLLDEGSSSDWSWRPNEFIDYVYLPDFIEAALKGEEKISIFLPLLEERKDIPRVLSILRNLKDPRAIEHIIPILRDKRDSNRYSAMRTLDELGYKPTSNKDKAAMEIVQLASSGGQVTRHQGIIRRYGIPAIELFLEDLRVQPPANYIRDISENAVIALKVTTKDTNQEWNDYTITRLIAGLNKIDEDVENKEQYIKDMIFLLGEIGDNRALVVLKDYLSDEKFESYAKTAMEKIDK